MRYKPYSYEAGGMKSKIKSEQRFLAVQMLFAGIFVMGFVWSVFHGR